MSTEDLYKIGLNTHKSLYLSELLEKFFHLVLGKVRVAQVDGLLEFELFPKLRCLPRPYIEDAREREGMAAYKKELL
jgi:hypothetical protein